ncbi:MAG: hypothetical protein QOG80_161, partial [Pseudonocardiales bacterium]|nr:hypothetical protein [Pseudonocardiales bacterium]
MTEPKPGRPDIGTVDDLHEAAIRMTGLADFGDRGVDVGQRGDGDHTDEPVGSGLYELGQPAVVGPAAS